MNTFSRATRATALALPLLGLLGALAPAQAHLFWAHSEKRRGQAALPIEIHASRARQARSDLALVPVKDRGRALANAEVKALAPYASSAQNHNADARGQITFPIATPGLYALRALQVEEELGALLGQSHLPTSSWTTKTSSVAMVRTGVGADATPTGTPAIGPGAVTSREEGGNPDADPRAYALLREANSNRRVVPDWFTGFEAEVIYTDTQTVQEPRVGRVIYRRDGEAGLELSGLSEEDSAWVRDRLLNLIGHRRGGSFAQGDGRHPLSLVEGDSNAWGQLLRLNDRLQSEYRVRDGRVTEVTRVMGNTRFTISVLTNIDTGDGKYLANHFTVAYRDAQSGALQKVEAYRDGFAQFEGVWLPTKRTVLDLTQDVSPRERTLQLRDIRLLPRLPHQIASDAQ